MPQAFLVKTVAIQSVNLPRSHRVEFQLTGTGNQMVESLKQWIRCSLAAGVTIFFVGFVFHTIVPVLLPDVQLQYETQSELFRRWEGTWTETYMMVHPFLYGTIFAAVFLALRKRTAFRSGISGGFTYGAGVFFVGSLPIFVLAFASFQVSGEIISLWILQNLCQYLAAGIAVGRVADV